MIMEGEEQTRKKLEDLADSYPDDPCHHFNLRALSLSLSLHPEDSESVEAICDLLDKKERRVWRLPYAEMLPTSHLGLSGLFADWVTFCFIKTNGLKQYRVFNMLFKTILTVLIFGKSAFGLAYQRLGIYTAAIKSFGRATELEESRVLGWVESGNILLVLNSFRKICE